MSNNTDINKKSYGTGRRKESVAKVWVKHGTGKFVINRNHTLFQYLKRHSLCSSVTAPLRCLDIEPAFDIIATVKGGGIAGQADAIKLGISRALVEFNEMYKKKLRSLGYLTRDARIVERKKYGRKKARKRFQFSKR